VILRNFLKFFVRCLKKIVVLIVGDSCDVRINDSGLVAWFTWAFLCVIWSRCEDVKLGRTLIFDTVSEGLGNSSDVTFVIPTRFSGNIGQRLSTPPESAPKSFRLFVVNAFIMHVSYSRESSLAPDFCLINYLLV
jgi:hypothetical protein